MPPHKGSEAVQPGGMVRDPKEPEIPLGRVGHLAALFKEYSKMVENTFDPKWDRPGGLSYLIEQ